MRTEVAYNTARLICERVHRIRVHLGILRGHVRETAQNLPLFVANDIALDSWLNLDALDSFFDFTLTDEIQIAKDKNTQKTEYISSLLPCLILAKRKLKKEVSGGKCKGWTHLV